MTEAKADRMVIALAHERAEYIRGGRPDRIAMLDEQLSQRGWCVDDKNGKLLRLDEVKPKRAAAAPRKERADVKAPETAAEPKPKQVVKSEASGD